MSDPNELVRLYRAANVADAYMVKNMLQDETIDACVVEENDPLPGLYATSTDVLVRRADFDRANELVIHFEDQRDKSEDVDVPLEPRDEPLA